MQNLFKKNFLKMRVHQKIFFIFAHAK